MGAATTLYYLRHIYWNDASQLQQAVHLRLKGQEMRTSGMSFFEFVSSPDLVPDFRTV